MAAIACRMACYTVEIPPGGQAFGPFCDEDGDGEVTVQGVTPGPIAVVESPPPADTEPADPARQEVEIVAGEEAEVIFRHGPPARSKTGGWHARHLRRERGRRAHRRVLLHPPGRNRGPQSR